MGDQEIVLDAEEMALKRQARLAGYRKTIAEGAAATMPDLSVDLPDRSLDVGDGISQLPRLVAQDVADAIADAVVQQLVNDTPMAGRTVLIVTDLDITAASGMARGLAEEIPALARRLAQAQAALAPPGAAAHVPLPQRPDDTQSQDQPHDQRHQDGGGGPAGGGIAGIDGLESPGAQITMALPAALPIALQGLEAAAKALPPVLEFARTDLTVRQSPVTVADEVVVAAIARTLRQRDIGVRIASCTTIPDNAITTGLRELAAARDSLSDAVTAFTAQHLQGGRAAEVERQRAVVAGLVKAHDARLDTPDARHELQQRIMLLQQWLSDHAPDVDRARAAAATATSLIDQVNNFLTTSREVGGSGLAASNLAALLHEVTAEGSTTDILQLSCTQAVGESVWKERWRGDQALHVGGLGVSWTLVGADGLTRSSGERTEAASVTVKLGEPLRWPPGS